MLGFVEVLLNFECLYQAIAMWLCALSPLIYFIHTLCILNFVQIASKG